MQQLDIIEREHGMESGYDTPRGRFLEVPREMHHRTGRHAVVLVDEYDKPVLDAIDDLETATLNRRRLRGLFGIIKFADAHIDQSRRDSTKPRRSRRRNEHAGNMRDV